MRFYFFGVSLSFLFLLTTGNTASSQDNNNITSQELRDFGRQIQDGVARTVKRRRVKGTPYLVEGWSKGYVMVNKNTKTETILLRFNTEENHVEFKKDNIIYAIDSENINGFTMAGWPKNLMFRNGFKSDKYDINSSTLLRIIYDDQTKFVAHHTTSLKEDLPTYGMASQVDEYVSDINYYIITQDDNFHRVKLRKKDIMKTLKDKKNKLEEYAESNDLNLEDENDVTRLIAYYNQITTQS